MGLTGLDKVWYTPPKTRKVKKEIILIAKNAKTFASLASMKKLLSYFKKKNLRAKRAKKVFGKKGEKERAQFEYLAKRGLSIPVYTL